MKNTTVPPFGGQIGTPCLIFNRWQPLRSASKRCVMTVASTSEAPRSIPVGIDLGTTNSVIAVMEGGAPFAVPMSATTNILPSVVAFGPDDNVLVGTPAKRLAAARPRQTFSSVKRLIGRSYDDVKDQLGTMAFGVSSDEDGNVQLLCDSVEGVVLHPEEVSAYVVAELLSAAQALTVAPISKAVISVPAYFDEEQREATVAAGRLAGLDTVRLLREPVAAALAYGVTAQEDETVLVLDLGGGTFDVAILEVGGGTIEVLSTGGDPHLGGEDFDDVIVEWLAATHLPGIDWKQPAVLTNLKALAEAAKVKLSSAQRVALRLPLGGPDGRGVEAVLTRQLLEELTTPLFRRLRMPIDVACWQAGVDLGTVLEDHQTAAGRKGAKAKRAAVEVRPKRRAPISQVLLVGGATRMPAFQRFVKNMTGLEPKGFTIDPDEAVAIGAAIQAGVYEGSVSNVMVMDIWQASLMRALAKQKLKDDKELAEQVQIEGDAILADDADDWDDEEAH